MDTVRLADARNFRAVDERLLTAGQPSEAQLACAASDGTTVVINLALHDDPRYSLVDERGTVESLGMRYVHIPVQFQDPTEADLLAFFDAMEANADRKVLLHCGANYRVTAFLGLYRVIRQAWTPTRAFELMHTVWDPNPTWARFVSEMLAKHGT